MFLTKTVKTLFASFGTLCLCSVIVMNLAISKLPPSPCQYHNISSRYQSFQKEKPRFARKPFDDSRFINSLKLKLFKQTPGASLITINFSLSPKGQLRNRSNWWPKGRWAKAGGGLFFSPKGGVFLSLISKHAMLRRMLVMNGGSLLTGRHQQHHTQILLKIEIKERGFLGFC